MDSMQKYLIPPHWDRWIQDYLSKNGDLLSRPKQIAETILKLSDHFQNQSSITPWGRPEFWPAYIAYFFPLNFIRTLKVVEEARDWNFFSDSSHLTDYGCGPGTLTKAIQSSNKTEIVSYLGCDQEEALASLYLDLPLGPEVKFDNQVPESPEPRSILALSYVINELSETPDWFFNYDKIIVLEPSTKQAFPKLNQFRSLLLEKGYNIVAPCPHSETCPLGESKHDWCHDRAHWEMPDWFQEIEKHLPIKNKTLSYSYLLASKEPLEKKNYWRVVGDPLVEKGKTRWMICRGEEREFLSFLKRHGKAPEINRGDKIQISDFEKKGNEIRFDPKSVKFL